MDTKNETLETRLLRMSIAPNDARKETLRLAHEASVSDEVFADIASAVLVRRRGATIILPGHRFENLSRGRGWARQGRGADATWGERVDQGYRVGPGRWTVGGNDGFSRKGEDVWTVKHLQVGAHVWTVAS